MILLWWNFKQSVSFSFLYVNFDSTYHLKKKTTTTKYWFLQEAKVTPARTPLLFSVTQFASLSSHLGGR